MSFGGDIARGAANILFLWLLAALVIGGVLAFGGYFGISWLLNHVSISVQ